MSTYTNDNNIRFLTEKNISLTLTDDTVKQVNTVPSLDLVNEVSATSKLQHNELTSYIFGLNASYDYDINNTANSPYLSVITAIKQTQGQMTGIKAVELLSSHVKNLKEFVNDTIDSLDVNTLSASNKFARSIKEVDGKVQATFDNVLSSDLSGQLKQTQVENLTSDIDSCYKKTGGLIDGDAQVNGVLSVANDLIVENDSKLNGNLVQGRGTRVAGDALHSVVMGISATTDKDNVFLWNGKQNDAYIDHGTGTFNINAVDGVSGVYIGSQTLEQIVDAKREAAVNQAKTYADGISSALSTDYVKKIGIAKNEAISTAVNTYAVPYVNGVSAELSGDYVGKIATAKNAAIESAETKLQNAAVLVSADLDFSYDETTHCIVLNILDYNGNNHTFEVDSADFIKGRMVDHTDIVQIDGNYILRIWWKTDESGTTAVHSDIPLTALAQAYHEGEGINITLSENGYEIAVDDSIVNKTFLNGKVAELNSAISAVDGKADTNTAKINSLASISADHASRISTLETGLNTANGNIEEIADDLDTANNKIAALETYANSLSTVNGQIQVLSNAIDDVTEYANETLSGRLSLDEGKIAALETYASVLSTAGGQIQVLSNAIDDVTEYANETLSNRLGLDEEKIDTLSGHVNSLQEYADSLSGKNMVIDTINDNIKQISSSVVNSDTYIGKIAVDYNEFIAGTPQSWIDLVGDNNLTSIIKYFNLSPNGYIKNNTIIQVAFANIPSTATVENLASLKYTTADGITLTDRDYIVVHGNFESRALSDIVPSDIDFINSIKRYEMFELSDAVYDNYIWRAGGNTIANNHAIEGVNDFTGNNNNFTNNVNIGGNIVIASKLSTDSNNVIVDTNKNLVVAGRLSANANNITIAKDKNIIAISALSTDSSTITLDRSKELVLNSKDNNTSPIKLNVGTNANNYVELFSDADGFKIVGKHNNGTNLKDIGLHLPRRSDETFATVEGDLSNYYLKTATSSDSQIATAFNNLSTNYYLKTATSSDSQIATAFNNLSSAYISRKAADKNKITEAGSFINILAGNFNHDGGGFRVCNGGTAAGEVNLTSYYTSYLLSCIRHYVANDDTFRTFRLDTDNANDSVVRKSTGAGMLSSAMYDALKTTLLNALYPVGSMYFTANTSVPTCPILTALGGTWQKPGYTVTIKDGETTTDVPIWMRIS